MTDAENTALQTGIATIYFFTILQYYVHQVALMSTRVTPT